MTVIAGLCDGEAAAQVFTLPTGMGAQKLTKVSVGYGHGGGTSGFNSLANLEIYDGLTWNGQIPVLGTKVFDMENDYLTSVQVITHGINEVDMSAYNVIVGNDASKKFVVAFRSSFNPWCTCGSACQVNFFTDFDGVSPFVCHTTPKTSLIDIQGQGWRDASVATVSGFPLCPIYFNGNWVIRACTENAGAPPVCQPDLGYHGPGDVEIQVCGQPLSTGNVASFDLTKADPNVAAYIFASPYFSPVYSSLLGSIFCPVPVLLTVILPTDATGKISLPNMVPGGGGPFSFYVQAVTISGSLPFGVEVSNCLRLDLLP